MADPYPQQCTQWLQWYNRQYGVPQKDPSAVPRLTRAIADYLHWAKSVNYTPASRHQHRMQLELFLSFVKNRRFGWQQLFTEKTREHFKKIRGLSTTAAVNGLSRYLVGQGQLKWLVSALSVGLGFGLQEIVANFVCGLIVLFERPFRIGDTVTIGGISGTVTRIRIRATTVADFDRKELIVPNKEFIVGRLINWSLSDKRIRIRVPVSIAYGSDTKLACKSCSCRPPGKIRMFSPNPLWMPSSRALATTVWTLNCGYILTELRTGGQCSMN